MVALHLITSVAQKETAKQALLKQLREHGAISPQMPHSLDADGDEARAALTELLAAGTVKEPRPGVYYLAETKASATNPGIGFIALLAILVTISFIASIVAIAVGAG